MIQTLAAAPEQAILRRVAGILGAAALWAPLWAAAFAAISIIVGVVDPDSIDVGEGPLDLAKIGAPVGFICGLAFGILLAVAESGKSILALPAWRIALWGALGSTTFPLMSGRASQLALTCTLGALFAVTLLALARHAARSDRPTTAKWAPQYWTLRCLQAVLGGAGEERAAS